MSHQGPLEHAISEVTQGQAIEQYSINREAELTETNFPEMSLRPNEVPSASSSLTSSTESSAPPNNARREHDTPGYYYITGADLVNMQIFEAEQHQRQSDEGHLWKSWPPFESGLPKGTVYELFLQNDFSNNSNEDLANFGSQSLDADLIWTSDQKSTFMELLGRKSIALLPEIAEKIKRPLFECQHYLNQLRGYPRLIDTSEIPAAEEVTIQGEEPDVTIYGPEISGPSINRKDSVLIFKNWDRKYGIRLKRNQQNKMEHLLREKLRVWILELIRQMMLGKVKESDPSPYAENVVEGESEFQFPEWLQSEDETDTLDNEVVNWDDIFDHNVAKLEFQEEKWLEEMDQYNSTVALLARGVPCKTAKMPGIRSEELESFMRAR